MTSTHSIHGSPPMTPRQEQGYRDFLSNQRSEQMTKKASQVEQILYHLDRGRKLTPATAWKEFGCMRLAAVVFRLRNGLHKGKTRHAIASDKLFGDDHATYWIER